MIATKNHSLFTPEPHYIPGYAGFYPQLRYQVGYTYGRTTAQVLTDPTVNKSPCSVLAPLSKPKVIEDHGHDKTSHEQIDADQPYSSHYTGLQPSKDFETRGHDVLPELEQHGSPVPDSNRHKLSTGTDGEAVPYPLCPPGKKALEPEVGHPGLRLAYGKEGWRSSPPPLPKAPLYPQLYQPRKDVEPLPPPQTDALDVGRFEKLPKLYTPNLIQHKAISGYAGFIPRFTWVMGVNYRDGVQQAMDEFDRNQLLMRRKASAFASNKEYFPSF